MKRIYDTRSYGKELIGYEYNGYYIYIEETLTRGSYGNSKKWYHCDNLKEINKASCFDTLKECKEYIDKYL